MEAMVIYLCEHDTLSWVEALATMHDDKLYNSDYSLVSLRSKVKNMKRQYSLAVSKGKLPRKGHDRQLFDLSKAMWGSTTTAPNGGARRTATEMCKLYPYLMEDVMALQKEHPSLLKLEFLMIDDDKARALDRNIKKQRVQEAKVNVSWRRDDGSDQHTY
jgi:hypothetical protein